MRIGVRVGVIRCFSAPQSRSASLPRRLRSCCSSAPPPPSPAPPRSRPFDPACCVEKLPVRWLLRLIVWLQLLAGGRAGVGGTSSIVAGAFQSVEDDGKADLSEAEKVLISTI